MQSDFEILGSSSGGNCALLRTGSSKILIDAGFSAKRIRDLLASIGETIDAIDAIFLTHEHHDHAQGMRGLSRRVDLPVFANEDTADAVQARCRHRVNWQIFQTGSSFRFRDIEVRTFSLPHDAYDPVGFRFEWGEDGDLFAPPQSLAWVTDLGYVPEHVRDNIRQVETLVIEANYEEHLLEQDTKRPWSTKQRIRGRHGHLSNEAVFTLLEALNGNSRVRQVYLAHLSRDCNTVDLVRERCDAFRASGAPFELTIVDPAKGTPSAMPSPRSPLPKE